MLYISTLLGKEEGFGELGSMPLLIFPNYCKMGSEYYQNRIESLLAVAKHAMYHNLDFLAILCCCFCLCVFYEQFSDSFYEKYSKIETSSVPWEPEVF